jgi:hypothetical protein
MSANAIEPATGRRAPLTLLNGGTLACPDNTPPVGYLDGASCTLIAGWAVDRDAVDQAIRVEIRVDGVAAETVTAGAYRPDLCGGFHTSDHGFWVAAPASIRDGRQHSIAAFAIDTGGGPPVELALSPRTVTCAASP